MSKLAGRPSGAQACVQGTVEGGCGGRRGDRGGGRRDARADHGVLLWREGKPWSFLEGFGQGDSPYLLGEPTPLAGGWAVSPSLEPAGGGGQL